MAKSIARYLADVASPSGVVDGTLSTAAQTNITSLGTLSSLVIADGGNIGSASDTDAISISSGGVVTMNQIPVLSAGLNVSGGSIAGTLSTAAQTNITSVGTLTSLTSGAHLINASSSAFGGSSVQGFNTDFLVDTGQGYSRHNSYHTGGSNHQFLVNATGSTTNTVALSINKDANATFAGNLLPSSDSAHNIGANATRFANAYFDTMYGTVGTAAQPNITSVGTLSALTVSGNVGIGNARTDGTLHVLTASAGTVAASTQADDIVIENNAEGGMTIITPDDQSARIRFTSPSTNTAVGGATIFYRQNINKMNIGTEVSGGILAFHSGAGAEAARFDADGNLVMATGNQIRNTQYQNLEIGAMNGDGSDTYIKSAGSEIHQLYNGSAWVNSMMIDDNGQVGIGKSPIRMLDIKDYGSGDPGIRLESAAQSMDVITLRNADGRVGFGGDAITVLQNGTVGIGETGPLGKLHVKEGDSGQGSVNSNFDQLVLEDDAHSGMTILSGTSSDGGIYFGDSGGNNLGQLKYRHSDDSFRFIVNNGSDSLVIESNGMKMSNNTGTSPKLELINVDTEDGDTGRESSLRFSGFRSGGESVANAQISGHHFGTADDDKGGIIFWTNTGSGLTEKMRIKENGIILIGKTSTSFGTEGVRIDQNNIQITRANNTTVYLNRTSSDGQLLSFNRDGTERGSIGVTTTSVQYYTTSDARLKDNIVDAPSASDDIDNIQVRSFDWKEDGSYQKYGMIAQELLPIAPEAVSQPEDSEEMMSIDYSKLVPMLVKEIQSLTARIRKLEEEK